MFEFHGPTTLRDSWCPVAILYSDSVYHTYVASNGTVFDITSIEGKVCTVRHELSLTSNEYLSDKSVMMLPTRVITMIQPVNHAKLR